jgi:hypothetical protein
MQQALPGRASNNLEGQPAISSVPSYHQRFSIGASRAADTVVRRLASGLPPQGV